MDEVRELGKLRLEDIYITFDNEDKEVLRGVNLQISEGEMLGIIGPSGCGKSTTLKIIAGLLRPDKGNFYIDNQIMNHIPVEKRGTVIVFQDYLLFPHLTVIENIEFGLKMRGIKPEIRRKRAKDLLNLIQLEDSDKKYPHELSGGQQQRVAIARGLAVEPKLLLLDEPFCNLDLRLREDMRNFVHDIQRKLKITTILITHDQEEAFMLCDRVAIMFDGKIEQVGEPKQLYTKPKSKTIAEFFGEVNYIRGKVIHGICTSILGEQKVENIPDGEYEWMLRPEEISLSKESNGKSKGKIVMKKFAGNRIYYDVKLQDQIIKVQTNWDQDFTDAEDVCIKGTLGMPILNQS